MIRDMRSLNIVQQTKVILESKGISTMLWNVETFALSNSYFSDNIPIDIYQSGEIYSILESNHLLDNEGYLLSNPREVSWLEMLYQHFSIPEIISEYEEHLNELMNAAYAFHEMTRANCNSVIQWSIAEL